MDDLQILNLDDLCWLEKTTSMINARYRHGCIVVNETLWVIGGQDEDSVEAINITNSATGTWESIGNFHCDLVYFGLAAADELIFIVGGYCSDTSRDSDIVYTINVVTNSIDTSSETLPFTVYNMPVTAVEGTIYGFGGILLSASGLDSWVKWKLLCVFMKYFSFFQCRFGFEQTDPESHCESNEAYKRVLRFLCIALNFIHTLCVCVWI